MTEPRVPRVSEERLDSWIRVRSELGESDNSALSAMLDLRDCRSALAAAEAKLAIAEKALFGAESKAVLVAKLEHAEASAGRLRGALRDWVSWWSELSKCANRMPDGGKALRVTLDESRAALADSDGAAAARVIEAAKEYREALRLCQPAVDTEYVTRNINRGFNRADSAMLALCAAVDALAAPTEETK